MKNLKIRFELLDVALKELGESDSSIEYAPHIRECFDTVIRELNDIIDVLDIKKLDIDNYFL